MKMPQLKVSFNPIKAKPQNKEQTRMVYYPATGSYEATIHHKQYVNNLNRYNYGDYSAMVVVGLLSLSYPEKTRVNTRPSKTRE